MHVTGRMSINFSSEKKEYKIGTKHFVLRNTPRK